METPTFILPDFGKNPIEFFREVKVELAKVIWPTRQELIKMTILIVLVSIAVGAFIGSLDFAFTNLFTIALQR